MRAHLISKHDISIEELDNNQNIEYLKPNFVEKHSIEYVIVKLSALDRIPFSVIASSEQINLGLVARGFSNAPKTRQNVKNMIYEFYCQVREKIKNQIKVRLLAGERFSLSSDQYTSKRNRRYMTLNVHFSDGNYTTLGVSRITKTFTAEAALELHIAKLSEFSINVQTDIIALVTDGASTMVKL